MLDCVVGIQQFRVSNGLFQSCKAKFSQILPDLLSQELKEVDHMVSLSAETLTELWILGRDTNWASVEVAHSHEDATLDYQWGSCKAKLLGTKQCGDYYVPSCFHGAVNLNGDSIPQAIEQQGLLCLGKSEFPWSSRVLQRVQWACSGATIVARNEHNISLSLCHTRSNRSHAELTDQLDVNSCPPVGTLKVEDQLFEILN